MIDPSGNTGNNWQVDCKDANCVTNADIKYSYLVMSMQKQKHN